MKPFVVLLTLFVPLASVSAQTASATRQNAMVATVHPLASQAAYKTLASGGNAVDAALTAAITLGVVDGYNSGIGGGCFILIRTPSGKLYAIDGRETAPRHATVEMYYRDGTPDTALSQVGALASGTPGAIAAYHLAWRKCGQVDWSEHFTEAARIAREGFPISERYARILAGKQELFERFSGSRDVFIHNGKILGAGERLVQADLATTLDGIATYGPSYFYRGPVAKKISEWMAHNGGVLNEQDFANYRAKMRKPIVTSYRGHTVIGMPPPSSGGVHVAQILNMLEQFPMRDLYREESAQYIHHVAEAMKLAFADRAFYLGDPDFTRVPSGLIAKSYAQQLANRIDANASTPVESHGVPPNRIPFKTQRHTTHIAVADQQGYWVAMTATVNTSFGSKVIVPGTGVVLNNEMDDFALAPGVANAFGLVGSEANKVESLKRPLSSMSPTIVLGKDSQQPLFTLGAAGGPKIITSVVLGISGVIDLELSPYETLKRPRFHHQWSPDRLVLERSNSSEILAVMKARGHNVYSTSSAGVMQMIYQDPETGEFTGVVEPRLRDK